MPGSQDRTVRARPRTPADTAGRGRIPRGPAQLSPDQGFDRTSTASIAQAASVPHGLIFYHFKTKMDLLLAVIGDTEEAGLDDPLPGLPDGAGLQETVAALWDRLLT